ncbi:hypothetical protein WJX73_010435 [Symbiochloris irregularis]|uniref:Uncharacterized protein n=1 Tax=Symbiochloris irregularis TaxID=706552 RepID=A0AAW1PVL8_9CHLO
MYHISNPPIPPNGKPGYLRTSTTSTLYNETAARDTNADTNSLPQSDTAQPSSHSMSGAAACDVSIGSAIRAAEDRNDTATSALHAAPCQPSLVPPSGTSTRSDTSSEGSGVPSIDTRIPERHMNPAREDFAGWMQDHGDSDSSSESTLQSLAPRGAAQIHAHPLFWPNVPPGQVVAYPMGGPRGLKKLWFGVKRFARKGSRLMSSLVETASNKLEQVLFVETGVGCDQHGQDITKAAVRACRNAIEFNSIPSINKIVPGGYDSMRLNVKIGCPRPEQVKIEEVVKIFPYGSISIEVVEGGLCCSSGIVVERFGDINDDMLIAVAAVSVGY